NPNHLFMQTFRQHVRVMSQLPYGTLACRESQISQLVVHDSQKRIMQEMHRRSRRYENLGELKRQHWSWINKFGGLCIHASVVLLLASLMFFAARYIAAGLGYSALLGADTLLNRVILLGLLLMVGGVGLLRFIPMVGGVGLLRFIPPGSRQLLRKQIELDNTLKLLNAQS
ncbi:MAG: hypothetical protein CR976_01715, partial [Thiotrichales bacterium]